MNKYDVYLAGAMTGRKVSDVLKERAEAIQALKAAGLTVYDPAADEELENHDPNSIISTSLDKPQMEWFVKKDLAAVANSRSILNINGDKISDGAIWEMAYAVYHRQIPVFLVAPGRQSERIMGFTNILVDEIHYDVQEAVNALKIRLQKED